MFQPRLGFRLRQQFFVHVEAGQQSFGYWWFGVGVIVVPPFVRSEVDFEAAALGEGFVAVVTGVGLFTRVRSHVVFKVLK